MDKILLLIVHSSRRSASNDEFNRLSPQTANLNIQPVDLPGIHASFPALLLGLARKVCH